MIRDALGREVFTPLSLGNGIGEPCPQIDGDSAAEQLPQWAIVVFPRTARIDKVIIHWGKAGVHTTSRSCRIHGWRNTHWREVACAEALSSEQTTRFTFKPVAVGAIRIWQDAGCGPEAVPGRMWLAELETEGEFVGDEDVDFATIRDSLELEWEQNYRASRAPITERVLACMDGTVKEQGEWGRSDLRKSQMPEGIGSKQNGESARRI